MTSVLSPIAPAAIIPREAPTALQTVAARTTAAVSPVETARAPQPVTGANIPEAPRNQSQRERPVGPPPSFEINVLQDIRTRLAEPPPVASGKSEEAVTPPDSDTPPEALVEPAPPHQPSISAVTGTEPEPSHALDMKV